MLTDKKVLTYKKLVSKLSGIRKGKKIVVTTGVFDIFHAGHLMFLDYAKRQGDILVVGVATDKTVKIVKGATRPILPEILRVRLIAGLEIVDFAVLLDEDLVNRIDNWILFENLRPDVWVVPSSDHNNGVNEKLAKTYKIKLVKAPRIKPNKINFPLSSSFILDKLK